MSGALYFYFWPDWEVAPPAPPPPPEGGPGAGGGHGKGRGKGKGKGNLDYVPIDPSYWDEREAYLRTLFPEEPPPAPVPDNSAAEYESEANRLFEERSRQLEQLNADRAQAIISLRTSADISEMKQQGARIAEINTKIAELMGKQAYARFVRH